MVRSLRPTPPFQAAELACLVNCHSLHLDGCGRLADRCLALLRRVTFLGIRNYRALQAPHGLAAVHSVDLTGCT